MKQSLPQLFLSFFLYIMILHDLVQLIFRDGMTDEAGWIRGGLGRAANVHSRRSKFLLPALPVFFPL